MKTEIVARERQVNSEVQLHVDQGILDFLVYKAVHSLLRDFQKSLRNDDLHAVIMTPKIDIQLNLVDSFLQIYHASHPNNHGNPILQFRIRLLRFATLFTTRWSQERGAHRDLTSGSGRPPQEPSNHPKSAMMKLDSTENSLLSSSSPRFIEQPHMRPSMRREVQQTAETPLPAVSLLETLPSFMALSAAANAMQESKITDTWMRLAAGYMAQAVLEQHMIFQSQDEKTLFDAFRWGFDADTSVKEGTDEWNVNAMFLDEEAEFTSWKAIKDEHMRALIPRDGGNLSLHLKLLQENELSFPTFNYTILQFLKGLSQSLPKPFLISIH